RLAPTLPCRTGSWLRRSIVGNEETSEMTYAAPLSDIRFVLYEMIGVDDKELIDAVLDEAARFAGEVLAPLNQSGDAEGARWHDGAVSTPHGFREAYEKFVAGGWNALA